VGEGDTSKSKRKRKLEQGRISIEIPPKGSNSGGNAADVGGEKETVAQSPLKKKRTLARKETAISSDVGEKDGAKQDTKLLETVSHVVDTLGVAKTTTETDSPWDPLFNPKIFLEKMVQMTGNSARFNSTSTHGGS
jgi:hypothetical protein